MNLGMNFRGGVERLPGVLEAVVARINTLWNKQHTLAGGHKGLTSDSIKVDALWVGTYRGIFEGLRGLPLIGNIIKPPKTTLLSHGDTAIASDTTLHIHAPEVTVESNESVAMTLYEPELALYRRAKIVGNVSMPKAGPIDILMEDSDQVPDNRKARIRNNAGHLTIDLWNNLETASPCGITWHRQAETLYLRKHANVQGTLQAASLGTTPINGANIIPGTLPPPTMPANIAYTNVNNNFTTDQTIAASLIVSSPNAQFWMRDTSSPVNQTLWRQLGYSNGNLYIESLKDPLPGIDSQFAFTRTGYFASGGINTGIINASSTITATGTVTGANFTTASGGVVTCGSVESTFHLRAATGVYAGSYFYAVTGGGYIFDGATGRGMLRVASGVMNINNDAQIDFNIGASNLLSMRNIPTFGTWANALTHTVPAVDNAIWLGYSVGYRWYSGAFVNAPAIGSDGRDKEILGEEPLGLHFINLLKPVAYRWKVDKVRPERRTKHGFVAQEVLEAVNTLGVEFDGVEVPDEGHAALAYTELLAPMVKAMQEMSAKIDALTAKVAALEAGH